MSGTTSQFHRYLVSKAYPGEKWRLKVKGMSDEQVEAIYFQLLESQPDRIAEFKRQAYEKKKKDAALAEKVRQIIDAAIQSPASSEQLTFL